LTNDSKYFAIKGDSLYWYASDRSRIAEKQIPLKEVNSIERDEQRPKEFFILHEKKCYRLEAESEISAEKWVNSLKMVMEQAQVDITDLNRYMNQDIYSKVTGKSLYLSIDVIVSEEQKKLEERIKRKVDEYAFKIMPKNVQIQEEQKTGGGLNRTRTGMGSFFGKQLANQTN
jgi:hypothetical protein